MKAIALKATTTEKRHVTPCNSLAGQSAYRRRCIIEFPVSEIPEIIKELQKVYDEN